MATRGVRSSPTEYASVKRAIEVYGYRGKHTVINGKYEPSSTSYKGRPAWVQRTVTPVYLFHTGKSRWVISKRMDDGSHCYAFLKDDGNGASPVESKEIWNCPNEEEHWIPNKDIRCEYKDAAENQFSKTREDNSALLQQYGLTDEKKLVQLWRKLDKDNDNHADFAELQDLVKQMCKDKVWPEWMNNDVALELAFKQTMANEDDDDDKVEKSSFHALLLNIFWFTKLYNEFREIDTSQDGELSKTEFQKGLESIGIRLRSSDAEQTYIELTRQQRLDFGTFCLWVRKQVYPDDNSNFDSDSAAAKQQSDRMRQKSADAPTGCLMVRKKTFADFDKLEKKIKEMCKDPQNKGLKKLWRSLDFNGNNIVSLAEIDKWVVETYPLLNHKPALIRAQKATLEGGDGDDWVERKEFKLLIVNLFYYNKLFWLFDQADSEKDRRMDFKEFQWCLAMCDSKLSERKAKAEFQKVTKGKGSHILFEDFCAYFVEKQCPEGMSQFVG